MSLQEEEEVGVVGSVVDPPPTVRCSICITPFPEKEIEGCPPEGGENWKVLVFQALCVHLNVKQVLDTVMEHNQLDSALKAFRLCDQCISYGWRLVVLDQNLNTIKTEITALVGDFRNIITTTSTSGVENSASVRLEQDLETSPEMDGAEYVRQFLATVAENAAVLPPDLEPEAELEEHDVASGDEEPPDLERETELEVQNHDINFSAENGPIPVSTSEVRGLFIQEDDAGNFHFLHPLNAFDLNSDLIFSSTNSTNKLIGNEDPHWVEGIRNISPREELQEGQMESYEDQAIRVQEYVVIEGGSVSPSPPYSPLSGKDSDDDEGEGEEMDFENEELFPDPDVKPEVIPVRQQRQRQLNHLLNDNLFVLNFEPRYCPPAKKAKMSDTLKVEKGRGRGRPKSQPPAAISIATKGPQGRPKKGFIMKIKPRKTKSDLVKTTKPRKVGPAKRKRIKVNKKILARLPPHEVEGYEGMCGIGVPFNRVLIKLERCSPSITSTSRASSSTSTSRASSSTSTSRVSRSSSLQSHVKECTVRVRYDDLFDIVTRPVKSSKSKSPASHHSSELIDMDFAKDVLCT